MSICGDGDIPAIGCEEFASLPIVCEPYEHPREFDFFPRSGVVPANATLSVEVQNEFCNKLSIKYIYCLAADNVGGKYYTS